MDVITYAIADSAQPMAMIGFFVAIFCGVLSTFDNDNMGLRKISKRLVLTLFVVSAMMYFSGSVAKSVMRYEQQNQHTTKR